jgi:hypothetical protein
VNAAILLMASAVTAGQPVPTPAPPPPPTPAPAVVTGSGGCAGDCGPVACGCDVGCKKAGIFDKIKARLGSHKHHCGCAPACDTCTPPPPAPTPCATCAPAPCTTCAAPRVSILDRLKAKLGKHHCTNCAPVCDGCSAPAGPVVAPIPGTTAPAAPVPSPMPTPKTPAPKAEVVVPGVVTPVSGPRLSGTTSPY